MQFHCKICNINVTSEAILLQHNNGRAHKNKLKQFPGVDPDNTSEAIEAPPTMGNPDPVQAAVRANAEGKLPTKRKIEEHWCTVCNVCCSTDSQLREHEGGKPHQKKVRLAERDTLITNAAGEKIQSPFQCTICSITVTSQPQLDQHMSGAKHAKNVKRVGIAGIDTSLEAFKKGFVPATQKPQVPTYGFQEGEASQKAESTVPFGPGQFSTPTDPVGGTQ